jgi:hypothetical protein
MVFSIEQEEASNGNRWEVARWKQMIKNVSTFG